MKFEWNKNKEKTNILKHGVTFADPFVLNKFDDEHSDDEDRYVLLGKKPYL